MKGLLDPKKSYSGHDMAYNNEVQVGKLFNRWNKTRKSNYLMKRKTLTADIYEKIVLEQ